MAGNVNRLVGTAFGAAFLILGIGLIADRSTRPSDAGDRHQVGLQR